MSLREVLPGTLVAVVGWIRLQIGSRLYASNAGRYPAYGSIVTVLLFVTWLYFGSIVVLPGASVNAVHWQAKTGTS